jgi:hypothetical protein
MENYEKFWAVWRKNGGSTPTARHQSKQGAIDEASRLCRKEGEQYYVLEVIGIVSLESVPTIFTAIEE